MIRGLLTLALLVGACTPAVADETQFRLEMIEHFRKAYPETRFAAGKGALEVEANGGVWDEDAIINLHRIFSFCQTAKPADCETLRKEFVGKIGIKPPSVELDSLRIIVRDAEYLNYVADPDRRLTSGGQSIAVSATIYSLFLPATVLKPSRSLVTRT